jgi:hypothetical protein
MAVSDSLQRVTYSLTEGGGPAIIRRVVIIGGLSMESHIARTSCLFLATIMFTVQVMRADDFAGGTGERSDPYQVATSRQLVSIGSDPNLLSKHFVLVADIDLDPNLPDGRVFTQAIIAPNLAAKGLFVGTAFSGSFDGNGHRIKNMIIQRGDPSDLALFGRLERGAVVKNLRIENADVGVLRGGSPLAALAAVNNGHVVRCSSSGRISGSGLVGGLVGSNRGVVVSCHAAGEVSGAWRIGGLLGENAYGGIVVSSRATCKISSTVDQYVYGGGLVGWNQGYIGNCYATGDVSGRNCGFLGGLVGDEGYAGVVFGCYATGSVRVQERGYALGGLVGGMMGTAVINCYAAGDISGEDKSQCIGGLVGVTTSSTITHCYATGRVSGGKDSRSLGGLIGEQTYPGHIKASFWDVQASGLAQSDGGIGLTTAEMQDVGTFQAASWDFVGEAANGTADAWQMPQTAGYPILIHSSDRFEPRKFEGSGTAEDPYRIATAEDIGAIWCHEPWACYKLTRDIDLAGITWSCAPIPEFYGSVDGSGLIISHLAIRARSQLGLLGCLRSEAIVMNLGVKDADIASDGRIAECGVLAGSNEGQITGCYVTGVLLGVDRGSSVGGLVGRNGAILMGTGRINDCYGVVSIHAGDGSEDIGGLIGLNAVGVVTNCYSAGSVLAGDKSSHLGGFVGEQWKDSGSTNCYFLAPRNGNVDLSNGIGVSLTDEQMKHRASFANWDFEQIWIVNEGKDYPHLRWENAKSDN